MRLSRGRAGVWLRRAALGIVAVAAVVALVRQWDRVQRESGELSVGAVAGSMAAVLAGVAASMLAWRALLADLGTRLTPREACRMFFVAQLGKYVPGSVWPLVTHMELGRRHGIRRHRSATALALTMAVSVLMGILLAAATLPFAAGDEAGGYAIVLAAVPALLVLLHPRVLSSLIDRALRLARREPLERAPTVRGLLAGCGWLLVMWVAFGVQAWLLARDLGGDGGELLPLAIGAFAVSWTAGFLVFITPAGLGVREAGLIALLGGAIGAPAATLLAVVSRLLLTAADLVWAAAAVALVRSGRPASQPAPERA